MADDEANGRGTRVDLAEDRTILANERTFAGWLRTGLATVAIGVGFHALFQRLEPAWVPRAIATVFLVVGIFVVVAAERRAAAVMRRLNAHCVERPRVMNLRLISGAMVAAMLGLIAAIWLLQIA